MRGTHQHTDEQRRGAQEASIARAQDGIEEGRGGKVRLASLQPIIDKRISSQPRFTSGVQVVVPRSNFRCGEPVGTIDIGYVS